MYAQSEGGKIVNIASIAGKRGSANTLAYNAANFGMIGMTQSMAREFGRILENASFSLPKTLCPFAVSRKYFRGGPSGLSRHFPSIIPFFDKV